MQISFLFSPFIIISHGPPKERKETVSNNPDTFFNAMASCRSPVTTNPAHLPPEIVYLILSSLDDLSKTAFALTSRAAFNRYPSPPLTSLEEHLKVLSMLEKDNPSLYICFECYKLHTWQLGDGHEKIGRWVSHVRRPSSCMTIPPRLGQGATFPFALGRVIMNRHFLGAAHGLAPEILRHQQDVVHESGAAWCRRWDAKIIDDALVLASQTTFWHQDGDAKALRDFIEANWDRVCCTFMAEARWSKSSSSKIRRWYKGRWFKSRAPQSHSSQSHWMEMRALRRGPGPLDHFRACRDVLASCPKCMTDSSITISKRENGNWEISLATYHDLGSFRSAEDWKWATAVGSTRFACRTLQASPDCVPGAVRRRWKDAERAESYDRLQRLREESDRLRRIIEQANTCS